jgi:methylglutaconyl-CoA hydratase
MLLRIAAARPSGGTIGAKSLKMDLLLYRVEANVAHITLNRPEKRNALNSNLIAALIGALDWAAADETVRVVLITGAGKDFCAGLDLKELDRGNSATQQEHEATARKFADILRAIRNHPRPVVSAVRGRALGGGAGIATASDLVLAAQSAWIGYPEIKIGFVPAIVSALLKRQMPEKRMFEMFSSGESLTAQEALDAGLFNKVFSDQDFDDSVNTYLQGLTEKSATALSLTKKLLRETDGLTFEQHLEAGIRANAQARMTEDAKRGFERFLKK